MGIKTHFTQSAVCGYPVKLTLAANEECPGNSDEVIGACKIGCQWGVPGDSD